MEFIRSRVLSYFSSAYDTLSLCVKAPAKGIGYVFFLNGHFNVTPMDPSSMADVQRDLNKKGYDADAVPKSFDRWNKA